MTKRLADLFAARFPELRAELDDAATADDRRTRVIGEIRSDLLKLTLEIQNTVSYIRKVEQDTVMADRQTLQITGDLTNVTASLTERTLETERRLVALERECSTHER